MKLRLIAVAMLFILVAALVPGVMAQDTAICGNLSANDCTALTTAIANTGSAGSGAFTLTSTVDIQSDDPTQAAKVNVAADGKFSGLTPISMDDVTALQADPAAAVKKITDVLKSFDGELNLSVDLPASATVMTGGKPFVLNLLFVDGVGYIDFSKLPATMTAGLEAYKIPNGWAGLDFIDVLTNIGPSLAANASGGTTSTANADLPKVQALVTKYLEYTRDGNTFTGQVDLVGLFNDADFQALTKSKPEGDAQKAAVESLKDVTAEVVFILDGDKLSEIQFTLDIPESTATALNSTNKNYDPSTSKAPKAGSFTLDLQYSGLGEAQTISAPSGAPVAKFIEFATIVSDIYSKMVKGLSS